MHYFFFLIFFAFVVRGLGAQTPDTSSVYTLADTALANRLLKEGELLIKNKNYENASRKIEVARKINEYLLFDKTDDYIKCLILLGNIKYFTNKKEEALPLWRSASEVGLSVPNYSKISLSNLYNNIGIAYLDCRNFESAKEFHEKSLMLRLPILGDNNIDVARSYYHLGKSYAGLYKNEKAIECFNKSILIKIPAIGEKSIEVSNVYFHLGNAYFAIDDLKKSLDFHKKALNIRLEIYGDFHQDVAWSFNNIGLVYTKMNDFVNARICQEKAFNIRKVIFGNKNPLLISSLINMGLISQSAMDYNKAIEYYFFAISILQNLISIDTSEVMILYNDLGAAYFKIRDYEKAIIYQENALNLSKRLYGEIHYNTAWYYSNLSTNYLKVKSFSKAIECAFRALGIQSKLLGDNDSEVARSYHNIGQIYLIKGDLDSSIVYLTKGLEIWKNKASPPLSFITQNLNALGKGYREKKEFNLSRKYYLLGTEYCENKENLWGQSTKTLEVTDIWLGLTNLYKVQYLLTLARPQLDTALFYAQQALAALHYQQNSISTEGSKAQLLQDNYGVYENAIQTSLWAAALDGNDSLRRVAFDYAEQSKAALLRARIKESDALHFAGIPDSLLEKEYNLRVDIAWRERQRREKLDAGQNETDSVVLAISSRLFDLRQQYDTLRQLFEQKYLDYYQLKYKLATTGVAALQQDTLLQDQTLLEYFVGDSAIFVFVVNKDDFQTIEIKRDFPLDSLVMAMRQGISDRHNTRIALTDAQRDEAPAAYCRSAHKLYEKLIAPVKDKLKSQLLIIPDGALNYLPFEALLVEKPASPHRFSGHHYLLRDHSVNYCYSATLWKEMREKQHRRPTTGMLLGMAPYFTGDTALLSNLFTYTDQVRKDLQPLPFAGVEVANITELMGGTARYGDKANKPAFDSLAPHYRILHLSTHGQANDRFGDYSFLAFGETKDSTGQSLLYVRDLYNYTLNADLVTLSACETGLGELQRGEGVVSLARAFSFAGAKSMVTSLWSVSDKKTQELMLNFYSFLYKGRTKDDALRQAKLNLIKKSGDPYYWAGFVLIGDNQPVREKPQK